MDISLSSRLRDVKEAFEEIGICWAVFAGAASSCYGSKRKVTDIDVLVREADFAEAMSVVADVEGVDVVGDLEIKVNDETCLFFMDDEMTRRVQRRTLLGLDVPIIPVEDNVVFKAILQRGKDEGKHDIEDIECMAKHERLDLEYLKERIRRCHAEKRVNPLLRKLRII